jgi:hypothetical protein
MSESPLSAKHRYFFAIAQILSISILLGRELATPIEDPKVLYVLGRVVALIDAGVDSIKLAGRATQL